MMHRIWRDATRFLVAKLKLTDGTPITILDVGEYNDHRGGPDFLNARIAIGEVVVQGHVELHTKADLWSTHGHDSDHRYSNVVLHVLLHPEVESPEPTPDIPNIPTLAISENLQLDRRDLWEKLFDEIYDRSPELPCFPHNLQLSMHFKRKVIDRFAEARLNELVARFSTEGSSNDDLLQRVYEQLFDALGYSENRLPFKELARIVQIKHLRELRALCAPAERSLIFEALFFGTAGLLHSPSLEFSALVNERIVDLQSRWEWLKVSVGVGEQLGEGDWAFFRIRPLNSPHRRIALAALLAEHLFSVDRPQLEILAGLAQLDVPIGSNPFWELRTSFANELPEQQQLLGEERQRAIALNVAIPAQLAFLKKPDRRPSEMEEKLREVWMRSRSSSSAHYINVVRQELLESESVKTVREEQGALLLTRSFCFEGRCKECPIGQKLIEKGWQPKLLL